MNMLNGTRNFHVLRSVHEVVLLPPTLVLPWKLRFLFYSYSLSQCCLLIAESVLLVYSLRLRLEFELGYQPILQCSWQGCKYLVVAMTTTVVSMAGHTVEIASRRLTIKLVENSWTRSCCNYYYYHKNKNVINNNHSKNDKNIKNIQ